MTNSVYKLHPGDPTFARWMQIKRLNAGQLLRLHNAEAGAFNQTREAGSHFGEAYAAALMIGTAVLDQFNDELGPFWPKGMTESDKNIQNSAFKQHIYKHWKPVWEELEGSKINELQALHQVDRRVHADEYDYPRRSDGGI